MGSRADGAEDSTGGLPVANTSTRAGDARPRDVDNAMKRPGRFDKQVFVPPPDEAYLKEHRLLV
jgi:SpoVK/Ycf46/Vps4 family AAA+-type ATPase